MPLSQSRARLDALYAEGRRWRDDDARAPTLALDRLLALQAEAGVPLALAVIPDRVDPALEARLQGRPISILLLLGWSKTSSPEFLRVVQRSS